MLGVLEMYSTSWKSNSHVQNTVAKNCFEIDQSIALIFCRHYGSGKFYVHYTKGVEHNFISISDRFPQHKWLLVDKKIILHSECSMYLRSKSYVKNLFWVCTTQYCNFLYVPSPSAPQWSVKIFCTYLVDYRDDSFSFMAGLFLVSEIPGSSELNNINWTEK